MRLIFIILFLGIFKICAAQLTIIEVTDDTLYYFESYKNDSVTKEPIMLIPGTKLVTNVSHYKVGGNCFVSDSEILLYKELEKPEYLLTPEIKKLKNIKLKVADKIIIK